MTGGGLHNAIENLRQKVATLKSQGFTADQIVQTISASGEFSQWGEELSDLIGICHDSIDGAGHVRHADRYSFHSQLPTQVLSWITSDNEFSKAICPSSNSTVINFAQTIAASSLGSDASLGVRIAGLSNTELGRSIATGDINGDGFKDIVIGAREDGTNGKIYVIYGGLNLPASIDVTTLSSSGAGIIIQGSASTTGFAVAVGDFNGDGFDDVAFSRRRDTAWILFGKEDLPSSIDVSDIGSTIAGSAINIQTLNIAAVDINGDGISDLALPSEQSLSNAVFILLGSETLSDAIDFGGPDEIITVLTPSLNGHSASNIGDVNGDGIEDLFINGENEEQAIVLFGNSTIASEIDGTQFGNAENTEGILIEGDPAISESSGFGLPGRYSGDFNNDGFPDIAIGAHDDSPSDAKAFIIYGPLNSNNNNIDLTNFGTEGNTQGVLIQGTPTGSLSLGRFTMLIDINNDGISDFVTGAWDVNNGGDPGEVYVIFGSNSPAETIDPYNIGANGIRIQGEYGFFGLALDAADMNCDGTLDLIVGAPAAFGSSDEAVYVFYG
ncbi:MAG: FG-GAP repeat protein [Rickettsiales bacterium]|nr:FG-GAP repeat protein [Rickettsiales bacterium]